MYTLQWENDLLYFNFFFKSSVKVTVILPFSSHFPSLLNTCRSCIPIQTTLVGDWSADEK